MPTTIPVGSSLARKVFGSALFTRTQRKPSLLKNITGEAPKQTAAEAKLKGQSQPDFPIVRVTDLGKSAGDTVSVDLFDIVTGKPVMGDKKLAGKMMSLSYSSQDIKIDQCRAGIDTGGRMAQQRTVHQLRGICMSNLTGYNSRLEDQQALVHLAGARGTQLTQDWVVPLATDPDYASIMVNPVYAPTYNRHLYAGDATGLADLDATNILTLGDIDRMRSYIEDSDLPLQPIKLPDDPMADDEPLYLLLVTARQWHYLQNRTDSASWRTFLAQAYARKTAGSKHPLFSGEPGMWNGIMVKRMSRAIRFPANTVITVATSAATYTETTATCAVHTDRAILLGAQALANVYGRHQKSDFYYNWHEEESDHGNTLEVSTAMMNGKAKIRFNMGGTDTDHGVMVMDSYAPDPKTTVVA
jgi:N4-gp56 family major capsid protein